MGNQKFTVALHSLCIFMLILLYETEGSSSRQKYGGRVLNISPTICKSARFPKLTGTCMISLECQQRSGTVIGACRDGVLFGACCHEPLEAQTLPPALLEAATDLPAELVGNVGIFDVKDNNAADSARNEIFEAETTKEPASAANLEVKQTSEDNQTDHVFVTAAQNEIQEHKNDNLIDGVTEILPGVSTSTSEIIATSPRQELLTDITTQSQTTKIPLPSTTESVRETTRIKSDPVSVEPTVPSTHKTPQPVSTSTTSTTPTPTTSKVSFGRINFSPKPFKPRVTTVKTVWTRPPTTEVSYVVFKASEEDDDEEGETYSRSSPTSSAATESISNNAFGSSASLEKTTEIPQKSVEQTTTISTAVTQISTESTTTSTTTKLPVQESTKEPELITTIVLTSSESSSLFDTNSKDVTSASSVLSKDSNETAEEGRSSSSLMKKSRIENDLDSEADESQDSSSSSMDHKLDDFVDQVVEGIAGELNKSNIDEVVFKSTTTSTTTTTEEPSTTKRATSTPKTKKPVSKKTKAKGTKVRKGSSKGKAASKTDKGQEPIKRVVTKVQEDKKEPPVKHAKSKKKPLKKVVTSKVTSSNDTSIVLDYRKDCGVKPLFRHGRIVGGSPSVHGSWPWHALVKETVWWGLFSKIKCGGVLIGSRHVLTAAHCQPQPTGKLSVVLGVTDSDNPSSNSVTKAVRRIIKHPQFNPRSYENDIAIIELESPVEFHPHIVPICLPERSETFEGKKGFVTGMGLLKHDGERPLVLHEVDVPIVNNSECQSMFRRSGNSKPIKSSFICAGYPQGLKDSCGGDSGSYRISSSEIEGHDFTLMNETDFFSSSGGPLSVQRENGQWVLAGTVSHGIKCAVPNQPGVYMRTTWFQPWIEKVTRSARGRAAAPRCPGPPGSCDHRGRSGGFLDTLFRVFRLARKMWQSRK